MKDDREPIDVLYSIEERLIEMQNESDPSDLEPRMKPDPGELTHTVLEYIMENAPAHSKEINQNTPAGNSRILTRLYHSYLVNRREGGNGFVYTPSELGEKAINTEQSQLNEQRVDVGPWSETPLSKREYYTLKAIHESGGNPTSDDINDLYCGYLDEDEKRYPSGARRVAGVLSGLYNTEYIDRTPNKTYRYWVTEAGGALLEEAQD